MEKLDLVIIPNKRYPIVLPKKIIIDTFPYAEPISSPFKNKILIGSLIYKNSKVPILDLEKLSNSAENREKEPLKKKRLVILACISSKTKYNYYAIVAYNNVKTLTISQDDIVDIEDLHQTMPSIFYSKVKIKNKNEAYILNLEQTEHNLLS